MMQTAADQTIIGDYTDFVRSLELVGVALFKSTFRVHRRDYFKHRKRKLEILVSYKPYAISGDHFDLHAEIKLKAFAEGTKKLLLAVSATFTMHLHGKPPIKKELVQRFAESDARLILWPYFREYVSSICGRAHVPPIVLPLSK